jgi:hypothetical protein
MSNNTILDSNTTALNVYEHEQSQAERDYEMHGKEAEEIIRGWLWRSHLGINNCKNRHPELNITVLVDIFLDSTADYLKLAGVGGFYNLCSNQDAPEVGYQIVKCLEKIADEYITNHPVLVAEVVRELKEESNT